MPGQHPAQRSATGLILALLLAAGTPANAGNHRIETGDPQEERPADRLLGPDHGIRSSGRGATRIDIPSLQEARGVLASEALAGESLPAALTGITRKISGTPMAGSVAAFAVSPDGGRAVFIANKDTVGLFELYSAPADGSAATVKISAGLPFGAGDLGVRAFQISPDSARVVFLADAHHTGGVDDIYSAPADGSAAAIRLNLGPEAPVTAFGITPDSAHAAFLGLTPVVGSTELFAAAIDIASSPRQISDVGAGNAAGDVVAADFSPDGSRAIYAGDGSADNIFQWYSVPIGAAVPGLDVQLSAALGSVSLVSISPDSSRVVYTADEISAGKLEVFSIGIAGGARIRLNPAMAGTGATSLEISSDGLRVAYLADQTTAGVTEVHRAQILTAGSGVRVNLPLSGSQAAVTHNISPDSSIMLYEADQTTPGTIDLFAAPLAGGPPTTLHGLTAPSDAGRFTGLGTPIIGTRAVYPVFGTTVRLFSVPFDGGLPSLQISLPTSTGDTLFDAFLPSSATRLIAYGVGPSSGTVTDEVIAVAIRGDLAGEPINPIAAAGALGVLGYEITADEKYAIYLQDADITGKPELYSYELDSDGDTVLNGSDNCQFIPNPAQGPVLFAPTLRALSATEFTWGATFDVRFVRGLLSNVDLLEVESSGALLEASGFVEPGIPALRDGFYYVIAHDCPGRSWQTATGAEPGRDLAFP